MTWLVGVTACIGITVVLIVAMMNGIDGIALSSGVAALGAVVGVVGKVVVDRIKANKS